MNVLAESLNTPPILYYGRLFVFRMWLSLAADAVCVYFLLKRKCLRFGIHLLIYATVIISIALLVSVMAIIGKDLYSCANEIMIGFKFLCATQSTCILICFSGSKDYNVDMPTAFRIFLCFDAVLCSLQFLKLIIEDVSFNILKID